MVQKIVSGGQTGVDRAALVFARQRGLASGGWCPRGRLAEDGPIGGEFPLRETPLSSYSQRTEWNVRDSDGTLILARGRLSAGTALTLRFAKTMERPWRVVNLLGRQDVQGTRNWLACHNIAVLNVAGPRERGNAGIFIQAQNFLEAVLAEGAVNGLFTNF